MCTKNHNHMMYSSRDTEWHRQNFISFWASFCPFSPDNPENQNFTIEKTTWRYYNFTQLHHKWQSYDAWFLRHGAQQNFLSFWTIFCHFTTLGPRKSKFWKNEHHTWRYYHFTNVYYKWQSYDVWFLRYEVQQTEFLVILDHFLPFYPH